MGTKSADDFAIIKPATDAVDRFSHGLQRFLVELGLPHTGVLVSVDERAKVLRNIPSMIEAVPGDLLPEAMYISKFVAACGAGLFDAALNFMWDEVVVRIRVRVARFDLSYFFDTAVSDPQERRHYQNEEDLRALSDAALIRGALKCGILTDIGYRHLDYIREMRNWASAAHPNQAELTGLQVVGWFETCLREVILKEPSGEILKVGRLLQNLREQALSKSDIPAISASVRRLPPDLVAALLRSIVGLYCDPKQDIRVRDNVRLVALDVWARTAESTRGEIGLKYANYSANGDVGRKKLVHEFLDSVEGLSYLPESDLALEIASRVAKLEAAHDAWDNFFNEPPIARELRKFVAEDGSIPSQVCDEYVRVLVRCRVGRTSGVANAAAPLYDQMIDLFGDPQIRAFVSVLGRAEVTSRLSDVGCAKRFSDVASKLAARVVDQPVRRVLDAILAAPHQVLQNLWKETKFQRLVRQMD